MKSNNFEYFEARFKEVYEDKFNRDFIYNFFEQLDVNQNPLNAVLKADLDEINHSSYGYETSILKKVYYFPEWDIYIMFKGTRQSYSGTEWNEMKEVKPTTKTIEVWES